MPLQQFSNSVKAGSDYIQFISVLNSNVNWSGSELHWIPIYTVVNIYLLHVRYIIFCSSVDFYSFVLNEMKCMIYFMYA